MSVGHRIEAALASQHNRKLAGQLGTATGLAGGLLGGGLGVGIISHGAWWMLPGIALTVTVVTLVARTLALRSADALTRGRSPFLIGLGLAAAAMLALGCTMGLLAAVASRTNPLSAMAFMTFYSLLLGTVPALVLALLFGLLVTRKRQLGA